jgi:hypothetical protein
LHRDQKSKAYSKKDESLMAVNTSRSMNASLDEGATDGKYRKVRPDTQVADITGHEKTVDNKQTLHPFYGYGFATTEYPETQQVNPGK